MNHVVSTERVPIKIWADEVEPGALDQAKDLANLPFTFKHVALMPDTHRGYGMPIGGVLATQGGVIIPNAVGVDIGCGMCVSRSDFLSGNLNKEAIAAIFGGSKEHHGGIRSHVPVGRNRHSKTQDWDGFDTAPEIQVVQEQIQAAQKQLGSLGGGNHFIEIQKDDAGIVWIMIHSGSRNFGYTIANYYNRLAQKMCERWYSNVPKFKGDDGLAFLPIEDNAGHDYCEAMKYAVKFAAANRALMMKRVQEAFQAAFRETIEFTPVYDTPHNYARLENHFGKNVWVHRKGATSAKDGELGIIPGSQGTHSYIVRGLGNEESFTSCSHGAGRHMSRTKAISTLDLEAQKELMDSQGIVHGIRTVKDLDEAPGAYKDIETVMGHQTDLVEILTRLTPLAVVKG